MSKNFLVKGQSLIELLIALGIFVSMAGVIVFILLNSYVSGLRGFENSKALFLAQEGLEAVRSIRNNDWNALAAGSHGLDFTDSEWLFSGTEENISSLKEGVRQLIVENIGADRKKITSKITWKSLQNITQAISLASNFANWQSPAEWASPVKGGSLNLSGNQNGLKIQTQGNYAYLLRQDSNPDFIIIDISDTQNPFILGSLNLSGNPQDIFVSGGYAYIASGDDDQELQIINISNPDSPSLSGTFDASGNANANGLYFSGSTVYLVRSSSNRDEFLAIDVSNPNSPALVGSLNLGATGNEVVVIGDYAYVASSLDSQELQAISLAIPEEPALSGSYNLSGGSNGLSIAGSEGIIVLGRSNDLINIFNIDNPNSPVFLESFDAQGGIRDMALSNNYVFLAVDSNDAELQIVDIATPDLPALHGFFNLSPNSDINGVAFNGQKNKVLFVSSANNEELVILDPL